MKNYGLPKRSFPLGLAVALLVLALDQTSKWWVLHGIGLPDRGQIVLLPQLNLTMVWNTGVTFGLLTQFGAAGSWMLASIALAVVAGLFVWLRRADSMFAAIAIGAIAGGAIGNVIDRLRYGAVVDFIDFHLGALHWYVFNVADSAIVCSVAALLVDGLRSRPAPSPKTEIERRG